MHINRRFILVRRFRKWLYGLVREEEELEEQATGWHRAIAVVPCVYCAKPIPPDSLFCKHCGFALVKTKQQTTGAQKLVVSLPVERVATMDLPNLPARHHVLTNQIEAALIPGEKHSRVRAYNRLKRQGQV